MTEEVVHCLSPEEVQIVLRELADWSISWDARSRGSQKFTSITLTPKMKCIPSVWQSPKTCLLLGEMNGKDSYKNLSQRMGPFWHEIQQLYDGTEVKFAFAGRTLRMPVTLTFPADMCAHWALFQLGGNAHDDVCMHCMVKYCELGRVFCTYHVEEHDTVQSIAENHGITALELRAINPGPSVPPDREEKLKLLDIGEALPQILGECSPCLSYIMWSC